MNIKEQTEKAKIAFIARGFWPNEIMWKCWIDAWLTALETERVDSKQLIKDN